MSLISERLGEEVGHIFIKAASSIYEFSPRLNPHFDKFSHLIKTAFLGRKYIFDASVRDISGVTIIPPAASTTGKLVLLLANYEANLGDRVVDNLPDF